MTTQDADGGRWTATASDRGDRCEEQLFSLRGAALVILCFVCGVFIPVIVDGVWKAKPTTKAASENGQLLEVIAPSPPRESQQLPSRPPRAIADWDVRTMPVTPVPSPVRRQAPSAPQAGGRLAAFLRLCAEAVDRHPRIPHWEANATLHKDGSTVGERLFCTKGRQLFRDGKPVFWKLPRGGTTVRPLDTNTIDALPADAVVLHPTVAVVTATLLSLFHMLNDFVLVWPFVASKVFRKRTDEVNDAIGGGMPLDYILLHVNGTLRGVGSDEVALMAAATLVEPGRDLRTLIYGERSDADHVLHCYCRAILQPPAFLVTYPEYPPGVKIIEGDPARRMSMQRFKSRVNAALGFLPYGTYPVLASEYVPYGLWPDESAASSTTPRLLLVVRKKSRRIGNLSSVVAAAKHSGFNVHVFAPEEVPVAVQARAARYADVLMGMHGQALTWLTLLDGVRASHCRWVVELCHFGRPFKRVHNVYELLAADSYLRYTRIPAVDVEFDPAVVPNAKWERRLLRKKSFPHELVGFHAQTAYHNTTQVFETLLKVYQKVSTCTRRNEAVPLSPEELQSGERVFK